MWLKKNLISIIFCVLAKCVSLREVSGAILGLSGKTHHFRLKNLPYRSTLSDANARRSYTVFEQIYYKLLYEHRWVSRTADLNRNSAEFR
jgi:hypothetical protein